MESAKDLEQLLEASRAHGDEKAVANAAYKLGDLYLERGKEDRALPLLRESFSLCRKHENARGKALVALCLTTLFLRKQDPEQAGAFARQAYDHFREAGDPKALVKACALMGDVLWSRKDPAGAIPYFHEALEICQRYDDNLGQATFLERIATQHRLLGQEEEAGTRFEAAGRVWERLGVPDRQAVVLTNLADIRSRNGKIQEAIRLYELALSLFRGLKRPKAVEALEKEILRLRRDLPEGA